MRSSDTSNSLMKFISEITKAWFLHVWGTFFEKPLNGKNPLKQEKIYGIKIKCREAIQLKKKQKKKKAIEKKMTETQGVSMKMTGKLKKKKEKEKKKGKKKVKLKR